jgi:hypothetical protein
MPKRNRFGKVPAPGEGVNDGRKTALSAGTGRRWGAATRQGWQEICPGSVRIPTKRRFFTVYQKMPADITMAGVQLRNR